MNANELEEQIKYLQDPLQNADYCHDYENGTVLEYLLTIRQQQAEIEALKVKAHEWYLIAMGKTQE